MDVSFYTPNNDKTECQAQAASSRKAAKEDIQDGAGKQKKKKIDSIVGRMHKCQLSWENIK